MAAEDVCQDSDARLCEYVYDTTHSEWLARASHWLIAKPFSIQVECFGTERIPVTRIEELIREHFDLRPAAILRDLDLRRPIYAKTAAYGHFGRDDHDFTWERTDKADLLKEAAGLAVRQAEPV